MKLKLKGCFHMAIYADERLKLVDGMLLNAFNNEVLIEFDTCEFCGKEFIGTVHNDPGQMPIELAISYCGGCPEDTFPE